MEDPYNTHRKTLLLTNRMGQTLLFLSHSYLNLKPMPFGFDFKRKREVLHISHQLNDTHEMITTSPLLFFHQNISIMFILFIFSIMFILFIFSLLVKNIIIFHLKN